MEQPLSDPVPRILLERLGEEPIGALSERAQTYCACRPRPPQRPHSRGIENLRGDGQAPPGQRLPEDRVRSRSEAVRTALMEQWIGIGESPPPPTGTATLTADRKPIHPSAWKVHSPKFAEISLKDSSSGGCVLVSHAASIARVTNRGSTCTTTSLARGTGRT